MMKDVNACDVFFCKSFFIFPETDLASFNKLLVFLEYFEMLNLAITKYT